MRNLGGDVIFAINEGEGIYCYHYRKPDYDPIKDADNFGYRISYTCGDRDFH